MNCLRWQLLKERGNVISDDEARKYRVVQTDNLNSVHREEQKLNTCLTFIFHLCFIRTFYCVITSHLWKCQAHSGLVWSLSPSECRCLWNTDAEKVWVSACSAQTQRKLQQRIPVSFYSLDQIIWRRAILGPIKIYSILPVNVSSRTQRAFTSMLVQHAALD